MATIYRNRQLMYLSALLFFYFASIGCLTPFLTSHMRHLGFSLSEIAFINAVSAFFSLIGPVLGGTFAERRNRYKSTTFFFVLVGSLAFVALSFVPRYEKLNYRPLVDFDCSAGLRIERCVNWVTCGEALEPTSNATKVKLSDCHYQCPKHGHFTSTYPLHICFHGENGNICVVYDADSLNNSLTQFEGLLQTWPYVEIPARTNVTVTNASEIEEDVPRAHVAMCNYLPIGPIGFGHKHYQGITCRPTRDDCTIHCRVSFSMGEAPVLPRPCEEAFGNPTTTFWSYLVLRSIGDLCLLTTICLLDAITIWSTIDYEGAYGRIHIWAALGIAAMAPLSGTLFDYYTDMAGRMDFSPSCFLAAAFSVITCILLIVLPIHRQKSAPFQQAVTPSKEIKFCSGEMAVFLTVVLILGMQCSILYTFLPWLTTDIGCSSRIIGLSFTLMFGFSIPFLIISKNMVRNIGKVNLLVFAFLFYFTRYAGITYVSSPWWTLPFAVMGSFTLCIMWIASVAYGQSLAPTGYSLIMQYILNILHFGLGRGIGSLAGGALISIYTQRVVFCGIAVFSVVFAFIYLTIYHLSFRKRRKATYPALLNGSWYPLRERYPNGDAKAHQPIVVDQDDDVENSPSNHQSAAK
ncbi:major facilitator superfamily domain-containing protein 6-A-like [Uloborus diversus]|uniref:major facilitator superfamily domain-containing protein 6-A-like n=1 Tax=Uloborus diversus TaxID=327109 RepID=UPI00240971B5|nr:major facilitator superfamily domain-containing protein 6-A-like [Uloborus diversus]